MEPAFVIAGRLSREYLLPPVGQPLLDSPGGNLLYAAGGLAVWNRKAGLLGRVGEDYPRQWLHDLELLGFDVSGIHIQPRSVDLRCFVAYTSTYERSQTSPVSHFARRQMTFPKSLLGYQPPVDQREDQGEPDPLSPTPMDVPHKYHDVRAVHLCPMDFISQSQLVNVFKGVSIQVLSLDPSPGYMTPGFWRDLRVVLQGVTVFQPSEEEIQKLFWGETHDLWEMAEQICAVGPQIVVIKRGGHGQYIYDSAGKHRWELPAYPVARFADPTGAGDAFCGGFLAGFEKTEDPSQAALYGSVSASLKVEGSGPFYPLEVIPGLADARLGSLKELIREV
jgi:sugar/nucleoside kinase (ribokinase family)